MRRALRNPKSVTTDQTINRCSSVFNLEPILDYTTLLTVTIGNIALKLQTSENGLKKIE